MSVPNWVQDAVFYQIFPDRFFNGSIDNDPYNVKPWLAKPTITGFHGGDLVGIIEKFDYLLDLGINAIYLNPVFLASSTHRYNTSDYMKIDPKLGTMEDFQALLQIAHENGVKVIIDGVFNHCGRGFFAFSDILENGKDSPYLNWFHVKGFPLDAYGPGEAKNYLGWWGYKSLPKFNTGEPAVRKYLLDVAQFWIRQGADGWRLDVPNEIDDDAFWEDFRIVVKAANPDAYLVGEIWDGNPRWVGDNHFDGLMNYPVRDAVFEVLRGESSVTAFASNVEDLLNNYPPENVNAMLVLLGSHDTRRIRRKFEDDMDRVKLAYFFPFVYPGAPCIYYGDEIGLDGGKDPDCRRAFPWDETLWDHSVRSWIKKLVQLRHEEVSLRRGDFQHLSIAQNCYLFKRSTDESEVVIAMNFSEKEQSIIIPAESFRETDHSGIRDLVSRRVYQQRDGNYSVSLPRLSGAILKGLS